MDFFSNTNVLFFIAAYLVGSIPFGSILAKTFAGVDIKTQGSKSIGATNVLRVVKETNPKLAKKLGIATVLLDALKGTVVLLAGLYYGVSDSTLWAIAVLAVLGHCYSVYLGLEGGKGVATGLGVYIVLIPIPTLIGAVVWIVCAKVLKISSLSSLLGLLAVIVSATFLNDGLNIGSNVPMYLIAFIIFYKHIPNIVRIIKGEEKKVI
ncbi:glycerol-3-phosphate 1-O-acyltransferase PlsY [Arcobacter aquimarinus]|uniref:Glycerol-3-phosphate acyltransferase n=1 Tax=Arcobacter aquimarinus TaxID=1315211 RepID=A0AAE7B5E7_9BACT|nr:glycerol-3-phosphate 1-O-acyltransferase PlsY [Arcobacter aquimarinus]MCB9097534.1 glycerol-3-phosphate 1-O-acyltransferase PlsY [Arcobacter sp.]QKE26946.1 acyl phosphate:glycerol-3-phosphate acyltransferase [Arcobacter aquimarinus]RXI36052.1 acyl-phosphate--glycerol-3-phosphate O-acyltransferase [Arcobacter aquimarinus]